MSALSLTEVSADLENQRHWLRGNLARNLADLASRATKLAASLDDTREVTWAADHAQGFSYDATKIEKDLAKLVMVSQLLDNITAASGA